MVRALVPTTVRFHLRQVSRVPWDAWALLGVGFLPLPRAVALWLAQGIATLSGPLTRDGRALPSHLGRLLRLPRRDAVAAARRWRRTSSRDRVLLYRMSRGLDDGRGWRIEERNRQVLDQLSAQGRSVLVATGHFHFAVWAIAMRASGETEWVVGGRTMSEPNIARALRFNTHWYIKTLLLHRGTPGYMKWTVDFQTQMVGAVRAIVHHLRQPGRRALLYVDLPSVNPKAPVRPFVGQEGMPIYLGAARIARLSGAAILPMVPIWTEGDSLVVEWGQPIEPSTSGRREDDIAVQNQVLDQLEKSIGRNLLNYTFKYFLYQPTQRFWNPATDAWEPLAQ